MHLLARVSLAIGVLAIPAVAAADDDAVVTDPRMQPPPAPPPTAGPPAPPPAAAQPAPPAPPPSVQSRRRTKVGIDLALSLPLGDYADGNDLGVGGWLRFAHAVTPELDITLRAGYLWHKTESDSLGLSMIPVLAGAVYKFGGGTFAYGEVGINLIRVTFYSMGLSATDGEFYFSFGAGGGYAVGKLQARLGFWMPGRPNDTSGQHVLYGVLGSVGVDFSAM
jgi:hypothetical protein